MTVPAEEELNPSHQPKHHPGGSLLRSLVVLSSLSSASSHAGWSPSSGYRTISRSCCFLVCQEIFSIIMLQPSAIQHNQSLWSCSWKTRRCPLAAVDWCNSFYFDHSWPLIAKSEIFQNAAVTQPIVPGLNDEMVPGLYSWGWLPNQCQVRWDEQGYKAVQNLVLWFHSFCFSILSQNILRFRATEQENSAAFLKAISCSLKLPFFCPFPCPVSIHSHFAFLWGAELVVVSDEDDMYVFIQGVTKENTSECLESSTEIKPLET